MQFIYAASGSGFLREAIASSRSLLKHNKRAKVRIYTDQNAPECESLPPNVAIFKFKETPRPTLAKIQALRQDDFKKAIYLDTDTLIKSSLEDLWDILDEHDFLIANEVGHLNDPKSTLPKKYKNEHHYNAGVFGYRRSSEMDDIFEAWAKLMDAASDEDIQIGAKQNDQKCLNDLIIDQKIFAKNGLSIRVIDNLVYNARGGMFQEMKKDQLFDGARILHCHSLHHSLPRRFYNKILSGSRLFFGRYLRHF